ncbi:MAG: SUMF1/EgtB/PvdO family nonheme iron enzyme [Fuerstiella sp.]|nr:SUMF1/EgtB/PvdO family nonheme iron enzyme [Fuerstiella sp.]MCP4858181.1 SUMF1/EgtB/PvdO family nonheme iron enzyme [Fuerstiella sp.]
MRRLIIGLMVLGALNSLGAAERTKVLKKDQKAAAVSSQKLMRQLSSFNGMTVKMALDDFELTYGKKDTVGPVMFQRLSALEKRIVAARQAVRDERPWSMGRLQILVNEMYKFKREALLSNPLLQDMEILCVKRAWSNKISKSKLDPLGISSNHECQASLPTTGYDNEIGIFHVDRPQNSWKTLYRPGNEGWVGYLDLHWNADRVLLTQSNNAQWSLWEMDLPYSGEDQPELRQVSKTPANVHCFDACYLPDDRIISGSSGTGQCVPCWHGTENKPVANLFIMNTDGSDMRRLTFDQDHNMHPTIAASGQVIYNRWEYTGMNRGFVRPLFEMNPDGTNQRAFYGSNSWFPNGLYSMQELPGRPGKFISIVAGYHGPGDTGHLVLLDPGQGRQEAEGIVKRISGRGLPLEVEIMDRYAEDIWPKFLTCTPISDKYFLVSGWMNENQKAIGIYLADAFDNLQMLYQVSNSALLEPIPLKKRPLPRVISDQVDLEETEAVVFLQDVYQGPGLKEVPRGTIRSLRVISYDFGYEGLAGSDKIGLSGPWDATSILGTTPVESDGSAIFRVPANTPMALQALDAEGKAVQLMRSWFTTMPGESVSCIGCHEDRGITPPVKPALASALPPRDLDPWYGPARGFDFAREVQPVLNRYCIQCHDGEKDAIPDLRAEELVKDYRGRRPGRLDFVRMNARHKSMYGGNVRYTPAYEALLPYIRRINVGDDVSMLVPGFYHADTSELIRMLQKEHQGVKLDQESWSRLITWIDLNGPCHGTWAEVFPTSLPFQADKKRQQLHKLYGGPTFNPGTIHHARSYDQTPIEAKPAIVPPPVAVEDWPFDGAARRASLGGPLERTFDLGDGVNITMIQVADGRFVMGSRNGHTDELPQRVTKIGQPFWMSKYEITNEQFRRFDPSHDSGVYVKRHLIRGDDKGMALNGAKQPALRVSWDKAMAFCQWLSRRTGVEVSLPTEAQWEYTCRAGADTPFSYGKVDSDFGLHANMADKAFATIGYKGKTLTNDFQIGFEVDLLVAEGVDFADRRFDDKSCMTAKVGQYRANAFGLHDMHGNAAEWTLSNYGPYSDSTRSESEEGTRGEKVARGGSFLDRPTLCRSGARYSYPSWQPVHNVGFRPVCNQPKLDEAKTQVRPIRHRFLALDESRKQLLYVDETNPGNDWTLALPADSAPKDFQAIGKSRVLIADTNGFIECDTKRREIVRIVNCIKDDRIIGLRQLKSGNIVMLGRDSGFLYEVDQDGSILRTVRMPLDYARVLRLTPDEDLLFCSDSRIVEMNLAGEILRSIPFKVGSATTPNKRSGYMVVRKPNGNYLASSCYAVSVAEVDPQGNQVSLLGGVRTPQASSRKWTAFTCFEVLDNGNTMVCSWNGHGALDSHRGPQLIEFDGHGRIVWRWHDPDRAGSIITARVMD